MCEMPPLRSSSSQTGGNEWALPSAKIAKAPQPALNERHDEPSVVVPEGSVDSSIHLSTTASTSSTTSVNAWQQASPAKTLDIHEVTSAGASTRPRNGAVEGTTKSEAFSEKERCGCAHQTNDNFSALSRVVQADDKTAEELGVASSQPFWYNGHLQSTSGGTYPNTPTLPYDWVGVNGFRLPCQFATQGKDDVNDGSVLNALLLAGKSPPAARSCEPSASSVAALSEGEQAARDRAWLSCVEYAVSAHIRARAHQQLFSTTGNGDAEEDVVLQLPLPCSPDSDDGRRSVLQWWSQNH